MKRTILYSLIAAAAACGISLGQVYTTPVGYVTEEIPGKVQLSDPDIFRLIGITLHSPKIHVGAISALTSTSVSDSTVDFTALLTPQSTYILEIESGASQGIIQVVSSWGGSDVTNLEDLALLGVAVNDSFSLRLAPTIEDTFGTAIDTELAKGSVANADIVWLPNLSGGFDRFFVQPANPPFVPNPQWVKVGGGANPEKTPIIYSDAVLVQRRGQNSISLVVTGELKTTSTVSAVFTGQFNYFSSVYPANVSAGPVTDAVPTVASQGLNTQMQAGSVATADILWVPQSDGSYVRYFNNPPAPPFKPTQTFDVVGGGSVDPATIKLSSGYIIQRRGADTNFTLSPPVGYDNL